MTLYLETSGSFSPWRGERIDDVLHPLSIETSWSPAELAALNLFAPASAEPVPEGKIVTSTSVQRVGGVVKFVHDLVDAPPPPLPSTPVIYAVGNFTVADMDISGIDTAVNFSAALWLGVGVYLVLFSETQANTQYLAKAYSGTSQALVVEKGEDYLIINASNAGGPYDPAEFSLEVIRVQ